MIIGSIAVGEKGRIRVKKPDSVTTLQMVFVNKESVAEVLRYELAEYCESVMRASCENE